MDSDDDNDDDGRENADDDQSGEGEENANLFIEDEENEVRPIHQQQGLHSHALGALLCKLLADKKPFRPDLHMSLQLVDLDVGNAPRHGTQITHYGRSEDGQSVAVMAKGWYPYLYVQAPPGLKPIEGTQGLGSSLQQAIQSMLETRLQDTDLESSLKRMRLDADIGWVVKVEDATGADIMGYQGDLQRSTMKLLKISVACPGLVGALRDCFHGYVHPITNTRVPGKHLTARPDTALGACKTYNSNIEPALQYLSDMRAAGCQWFEVDHTSVEKQQTRCDGECAEVDYRQIRWLSLSEHSSVRGLRTVSFDIEVAGNRGEFPDPKVADVPVIQIALNFHQEGTDSQTAPVLLSLRQCNDIDGADVVSFDSEEALLQAFAEVLNAFDPDIITGYNINNFDFPFLVNRAKRLGVEKELADCSRRLRRGLQVRECIFESAQVGRQVKNKIMIAGRIVLDVLNWMRDNFMLESYTLKNVCAKFLKDENKEDVAFTEITPMWNAGVESRTVLAVYCLKDAKLPLELIAKLSIRFNAVERARVTKLPCDMFLKRGMLVRFTSLLLHEANDQGYVLPFVAQAAWGAKKQQAGKKRKFQGATVLPVVRGLMDDGVVAALDFNSLYPSLIIGHNLCYSTIVLDTRFRGDANLHMMGHSFVPVCTRKGVVPTILEGLLAMRKRCKDDAAKATDPLVKYAMEGRQLACKVTCNSIYGAMGCEHALLPLRAIAETVTALGRDYIMKVKAKAEAIFSVDNGYERDALVVGGDTDSVFVRLPVPADKMVMQNEAAAAAMEMADILADAVNKDLPPPMHIEVEKVYHNLLFMMKKRYAGLKYAYGKADAPPTVDIKGVECVRRDGCNLVRNLVREVLEKLVHTGNVSEAAAIVRAKVQAVLRDEVPLDEYAIKKNLRKSMEDCMQPLTSHELSVARNAIAEAKGGPKAAATSAATNVVKEKRAPTKFFPLFQKQAASAESEEPPKAASEAAAEERQLSYAEMDAAIRCGAVKRGGRGKINVRIRQHLPQVMVAWKMRLEDPGQAPVPGTPVHYIVSLNGGSKVCEKAESLEYARARSIQPDRAHYLKALRSAIDGIFTAIFDRRVRMAIAAEEEAAAAEEDDGGSKRTTHVFRGTVEERVERETERLLWRELLQREIRRSAEQERAVVAASCISRAFMRQQASGE